MEREASRSSCLHDRDELSQVFMQHREHLRNMIQTRLDQRLRSRVDASDIVQELFLRANQGLDNYINDPVVSPIVWLRQIGKHLVAETHRKHFRSKRNPNKECTIEFDEWIAHHLAESMESVGTKIARAELYHRVLTMLKELPECDREIIELKHLDSVSFVEAAEILQLPLETVKKRYYRALVRFQGIAARLELSGSGE